VHLDVEEAGSDRVGYGYATTVHRSQGSTTERAHLFADGGSRELAYVAMSRARHSTQVWTVADNLPQAADDLRRDWSIDREIAHHQVTLDRAASRFEHRRAASQAVIDNGLGQQGQTRNLADRIGKERNHLDGVSSVANIRRAAMRAEQLKGFRPAFERQPPASRSPGIEM
jgi:hypothetical protein